jgi:hypothetical protein
MIVHFEQLGPGLQAKTPTLSPDHPDHERFNNMNAFEKEEYIRNLIPEALRTLQDV